MCYTINIIKDNEMKYSLDTLTINKADNGWMVAIEKGGDYYLSFQYVFTSTKDLEEFLSNTFKEMEEEKEEEIDEN